MCNFCRTFVADLIWTSVRIRAMMCFFEKKREFRKNIHYTLYTIHYTLYYTPITNNQID